MLCPDCHTEMDYFDSTYDLDEMGCEIPVVVYKCSECGILEQEIVPEKFGYLDWITYICK